jgi:peroxiredoxin
MLDVGNPAPDVELTFPDGQPVKLSSFWSRQPVVIVFARHFG